MKEGKLLPIVDPWKLEDSLRRLQSGDCYRGDVHAEALYCILYAIEGCRFPIEARCDVQAMYYFIVLTGLGCRVLRSRPGNPHRSEFLTVIEQVLALLRFYSKYRRLDHAQRVFIATVIQVCKAELAQTDVRQLPPPSV